MPHDGRTRCKLCQTDHRLSEPHRFPDEPAPRVVQTAPPSPRRVVVPPRAITPAVPLAPAPTPSIVQPAPSPVTPADVPRDERARLLAAEAARAYRARQKAERGTTADRTSAERSRRYRERRKAMPRDPGSPSEVQARSRAAAASRAYRARQRALYGPAADPTNAERQRRTRERRRLQAIAS